MSKEIVAYADIVGGDSVRGIQLVGKAASNNLNLSLDTLFNRMSGALKNWHALTNGIL